MSSRRLWWGRPAGDDDDDDDLLDYDDVDVNVDEDDDNDDDQDCGIKIMTMQTTMMMKSTIGPAVKEYMGTFEKKENKQINC